MFRGPVLSSLLAAALVAIPARAQAPGRTLWTLTSGEYTIYGHTVYTPAYSVVPRIVYDTARRLDSARVVDSVRAATRTSDGFAAGLSAWPADLYCGGPATAATQPLAPRALPGRLRHAARCGVRLIIVPPRRLLTTNGRTTGPFSIDSARRVIDRYADVLPPDTLRKYRTTILGFNLADDYSCAACWGGSAITQAQIAEWAAYARERLPGVPLGVRVIPDWVAKHPPLAPLLDYAWAQYHTRKGDPGAFYDRAAARARALGLQLVMGVNVEDCYGMRTDACTPADLVRLGTLAVSHPASCAFLSWRYDPDTWARAEIRQAWDTLMAVARRREARECRRAERDAPATLEERHGRDQAGRPS